MSFDLPFKEKVRRKIKYKVRNIQDFYVKNKIRLWGGWHMQDIFSYYVSHHLDKYELDKLCSGLDKESIAIIQKIISRMQYIYKNNQIWLNDLTKEEELKLQNFKQQNSIKISNPQGGGDIYFNFGYYLPHDCFSPGVFIEHHGIELFKNQNNFANKHIIDVGGYIGDSALILSQFTSRNIHTFEATTLNYQRILQTIKLNNCQNIIPIKQALGSKHEQLEIGLDESASSFLKKNYAKTEKVEVITLDEYVQKNSLEVGLIKVDIEGYEMEFLQGAIKTIQQQKPSLIISIYHSPQDFFGIKPFIESLDLGYRFYIFKPTDVHIFLETCLLCECL